MPARMAGSADSATSFASLAIEGNSQGWDSTTALRAFLVVMLGVPSALGVGALGSAGSLATILGIAGFLWWSWFHINRTHVRAPTPQPVRWALIILLLMIVVSYANAMFHPLSSDEQSPADMALLRMLSLSGVALLAQDGIRSTERLHALLRAVSIGAALMGALSALQFITGQLWIDRLSIPGLTRMASASLDARQGLTRPSGTAVHPIEFASFMAMCLPVAVMYVRSQTRLRPIHVAMIGLIFLGILLSLSRTALLCLVIGSAIILPALPRSWRIFGGVGAVGALGALYALVPGFVGTLRGLFVGLDDDPSVISRTSSYDLVGDFVTRSPWIGRGMGTFLPKYWILDNMYLHLLIEIGVLGVLALIGLIVAALISALLARRRFTNLEDRDLVLGVAAGIAAGSMSLAFFDAFAFPQSAFTLFLLLGVAGASWRLARQEPVRLPAVRRSRTPSTTPTSKAGPEAS